MREETAGESIPNCPTNDNKCAMAAMLHCRGARKGNQQLAMGRGAERVMATKTQSTVLELLQVSITKP